MQNRQALTLQVQVLLVHSAKLYAHTDVQNSLHNSPISKHCLMGHPHITFDHALLALVALLAWYSFMISKTSGLVASSIGVLPLLSLMSRLAPADRSSSTCSGVVPLRGQQFYSCSSCMRRLSLAQFLCPALKMAVFHSIMPVKQAYAYLGIVILLTCQK